MNAGGTTGAGGIGGVSAGGAGGCSASLETDPKNCGACGHDCLGGKCEGAICRPFSVAEIPREYTRAIGLSPDYVLVSGSGYQNGAAAIYSVDKSSGAVNRTRPQRVDGSYSRRMVGTVSLDASVWWPSFRPVSFDVGSDGVLR